MNSIQKYLKQRNLSGAEAALAKQFLMEGKDPIEVDFILLEYHSDGVANRLYEYAIMEAQFLQEISESVENELALGEFFPEEIIHGAHEAGIKARYIKSGLEKIFPNIAHGIENM